MQSKASQGINMRNRFFLLCVLLLVGGVYGDQKVGVSVGDSVTLKPDAAEIQRDDDEIMWKYNGSIVARMKKTTGLFSTFDGPDNIFSGRLQLDNQTRYLTITNIRTTDSGKYLLHIRRNSNEIFKEFSVTVHDTVKSVSVVEGDTVTLHTGVTDIQRADLKGPDGATWSNLNNETGEITIRNIPKNQSGDYKLEINTSSVILQRTLHITISGKVNTVLVKKEESIILYTGLIDINGYDLIMWKFDNQLIAEIDKTANQFLPHDTSDERFKGRLQLSEKSGSLTIGVSGINDTGVYHLHMISSTHTIQRNISVTVKKPDLQVTCSDRSGAVSGISGASVGLMLWAVTVFLLQEV